jgi:LacI family transcriptional regulator
VVDLTVECRGMDLPRVISDHLAIGRLGGEHFRERGFENVAWFSSGWSEVHRLRYDGFAAAFGSSVPRIDAKNLRQRLAKASKPIGILAYNDTDAALAIYAAGELGLVVPDDVSVLGIGDDPFLCENQSIPISSVRQDLARGAYEGAALLQHLMDGAPQPRELVLIPPTGLTARASTDTIANQDPFVRAALVYINRHLGESFGTPEIAASIGLPRHKLDHLFAKKLGHSVGSEVHDRRIAKARQLLSDPTIPVREVASQCGFCNVAYLSNVFRKATGLSPRAWRAKNLLP